MRKVKRLEAGDTIAFITLSSGMAGESIFQYRWKVAKERLEALGFHVVLTKHATHSSEYIDQHPEKRAEDLMNALKNPDIQAIVCMIGGDDTIRLLPYIDFETIKQYPKLFIGYSDSTVNHFMFHYAGIPSIYGPTALVEFAENVAMHSYTQDYFFKLVSQDNTPFQIQPSSQWTSEFLDWTDERNQTVQRTMTEETHFHEFLQGTGIVRGKLLGGCLETFPMMIGTKIWPKVEHWQDKVLFIETSEIKLSPSMFAVLLRGLVAQGIFHQVQGILMGKPVNETFYQEYKDILQKIIRDECQLSDLPIVYNMNFGHTAPIISLPIGCEIEINCLEQTIQIVESPVEGEVL
uniref:S66 family peptidase n=1 Tax=Candidatus Enterococcus willemsii TaxID=1857215 RepID=UPI00403F5B6C